MHYGTFFFANIVSVTAFTLCIGLLALWNRRIVGMRWFAAALVAGLIKLVLQGLEGHAPASFSMVANELYLLSFFMQYLGLRWFVVREPMRDHWPTVAIGLTLALYTTLFFAHVPYSGNVLNIPFVILCALSAHLLLREGQPPFTVISRLTAAVLLATMAVSTYRAVLTNLCYRRPWETFHAHNDPRWLYSLALMAFLATLMTLCQLGFLVAELQRELAEQARTDSLTGALNRRAIEDAALRETARSLRHGSSLCMIMIDVDNFKMLNDKHGHIAGDRALQALARTVQSILRVSDFFARTGGEEFAILLPGADADAAFNIAERIRTAIALHDIPYETGPLHITVSIGLTLLAAPDDTWEAMMRRADAAMYEAKHRGRNQVSTLLCADTTTLA
jgi:diguanylate cyclase (GGDEF)-like protein